MGSPVFIEFWGLTRSGRSSTLPQARDPMFLYFCSFRVPLAVSSFRSVCPRPAREPATSCPTVSVDSSPVDSYTTDRPWPRSGGVHYTRVDVVPVKSQEREDPFSFYFKVLQTSNVPVYFGPPSSRLPEGGTSRLHTRPHSLRPSPGDSVRSDRRPFHPGRCATGGGSSRSTRSNRSVSGPTGTFVQYVGESQGETRVF